MVSWVGALYRRKTIIAVPFKLCLFLHKPIGNTVRRSFLQTFVSETPKASRRAGTRCSLHARSGPVEYSFCFADRFGNLKFLIGDIRSAYLA